MHWSKQDYEFMSRALQLARKGLYTTHPNPHVGCVIVKDQQIIAEGFHHHAGGPHAEIVALQQINFQAQGCSCYVTLEPCCHQGRTPPCSDHLIKSGIKRLVVATADPNPKVSGNGLAQISAHGIQVESGLLADQAKQLNLGFLKRMTAGKPYVRAKLAMSLDGRTALSSGVSQWITSPSAREDVQHLRARSAAILTGIGTVLTDNPSLTVRSEKINLGPRGQPLRVVLDPKLQIPNTARMLNLPGKTIVFTQNTADQLDTTNYPEQVEIIPLELISAGKFDLSQLLMKLAKDFAINEVLIEAGANLTGAFLSAHLVDELIIYLAPRLFGHHAAPLVMLDNFTTIDSTLALNIQDVRAIGKDWRITATFSE